VIRAPFAGTIVEKHVSFGEAIKEDATIFTDSDLGSVWAEIAVAPKDLSAVRVRSLSRRQRSTTGCCPIALIHNLAWPAILARTVQGREHQVIVSLMLQQIREVRALAAKYAGGRSRADAALSANVPGRQRAVGPAGIVFAPFRRRSSALGCCVSRALDGRAARREDAIALRVRPSQMAADRRWPSFR